MLLQKREDNLTQNSLSKDLQRWKLHSYSRGEIANRFRGYETPDPRELKQKSQNIRQLNAEITLEGITRGNVNSNSRRIQSWEFRDGAEIPRKNIKKSYGRKRVQIRPSGIDAQLDGATGRSSPLIRAVSPKWSAIARKWATRDARTTKIDSGVWRTSFYTQRRPQVMRWRVIPLSNAILC